MLLIIHTLMMKKRKLANPFQIAVMSKRTLILLANLVPLSPLFERTLPNLRASNLRMTTCKLLLLLLWVSYYVCFYSVEVTPPPTPSPVKAAGGKKRGIAAHESDDDDVIVPR
jgi:hypothetical protein